jgi:LPXTG-site transpeptidase (sortase) family protein
MAGSSIPAGWYPDPTGQPGVERYFDGDAWDSSTRVVSVSFPEPAPPDTAAPLDVAGVRRAHLLGDVSSLAAAPDPLDDYLDHSAPAAQETSAFPSAPGHTAPAASVPGGASPLPTLSGEVDPNSSQALLEGVPIKLPKRRPVSADAGWYPDPARTNNFRFYDGNGWTSRVRHREPEHRNKLPAATLSLQSKIVEAVDSKAVRSRAGERFRSRTLLIEGEQKLPLMHRAVRSRAGRVGGMISVAAVVAGLGWASLVGWEHWLSGEYQDRVQADMRKDLEGEIPLEPYDLHDPTPVDVGSQVVSKPPVASTEKVNPWAPQADIPLPPAGWVAPEGREERVVNEFKSGKPVGRIVVPRIGVDRVMVAGTNKSALAKGVGVGTWGVLPGSPGNATLAGHRIGNGQLFRNMDKLRYGDQIIIEIPGQGKAVFEVRAYTIVKPTDTKVLDQTDGVRLTLTTCHPPGSTGKRYVVQAELVSGDWADKAINRSAWHINT